MKEVEYREIPEFPGYRAGSDGSVWSTRKKCNEIVRTGENVVKVNIHNGIKFIQIPVYRLILESFGHGKQNDRFVFYKNFNFNDNSIGNLAWADNKLSGYDYVLGLFKPEYDDIDYKEIPEYVGYIAGTDGSIWSCYSKSINGIGEWHKMIPCPKPDDGKLQVVLHIANNKFTEAVHRLVLKTFIGPRPVGMEGCHNNGNGQDNRLKNLRYDTKKANGIDKRIHGVAKGSKNGFSKLDEIMVKNIKDKIISSCSIASLSRVYNVHYSTIWLIKANKTWTHVSGEKLCQD